MTNSHHTEFYHDGQQFRCTGSSLCALRESEQLSSRDVALDVERLNQVQQRWEPHPSVWRIPRELWLPALDQMGMRTDVMEYVDPRGIVFALQEDPQFYAMATAHFLTQEGRKKLIPRAPVQELSDVVKDN